MDIHIPKVLTDGGPWVEHDLACAVCQTRSSVYDLNTGVFQPCWHCQEKGWSTVKRRRFRLRTRRF